MVTLRFVDRDMVMRFLGEELAIEFGTFFPSLNQSNKGSLEADVP